MIFLFLVFYPPGRMLLEQSCPDTPLRLKQLASFGISAIVYAAILTLGLHYELSNGTLSLALLALCSLGLASWLHRGTYRQDLSLEMAIGFTLIFLYAYLATVFVAFPDGNFKDISWDQTIHLSTLPVDSVIPYNVSRYIVERIDPNLLEVVPSWRMSDRGPLGGMSNAVIFLFLGLEESARWVTSSPGLYFAYSLVITSANLLSLLAVLFIGWEWFGRRGALCSTLILTTTYFYFLNTFFTWPKFFMAYYVLTALAIWLSRKNWLLTGILFGGASLSHNSALFSFLIFTTFALGGLGISLFKQQTSLPQALRNGGSFLGGYIVITSPWIIFKQLFSAPSPRLVYMHAFCIFDPDVDKLSFSDAFSRYLSNNSLNMIIETKMMNIIYPFNPSWLVEHMTPWRGVMYFLFNISHLVFFQLYLAVGVIFFIFSLMALYCSRKDKSFPLIVWSMGICLGAVVVLALASGCANNTVNHQWAYQAFLAIALAAGWVLSRGGVIVWSLASIGIALNITLGVAYLWYRPTLKPFLHAGSSYTLELAFILSLYICTLLTLIFLSPKDS